MREFQTAAAGTGAAPGSRCREDLAAAVTAGLARNPRQLPCRFFYDDEGSRLFDEICRLPEYYLTRTEARILREQGDAIAALLPEQVRLVELGSGSAVKTRLLIEAILRRQPELHYLPVDISAGMLAETARVLARDYPRLTVEPVVAEYAEATERLRARAIHPKLVLFLGSNLGNFTPAESVRFLRELGTMLGPNDRVLLGLDLQKDPEKLEAAYDDAAGVTARFNLNLLRRINRELGADFDLSAFRHHARYNAEEGRIEMHLVSTRDQAVTIRGRRFRFREGESIHTENSYKYTLPQIRELAGAAGLELTRTWQDDGKLFSVNLFRPALAPGS